VSDSPPRRVAILGSTGSIGTQALDVVRANPELLDVVALVAGSDADALARQAEEFGVRTTGLGAEAARDVAALDDVDVVLNAVMGAVGLRASVAALESGKVLALANKESLVAGGEVCTRAAAVGAGTIVPVDSEHAALFQCLSADGSPASSVILTASGGPFRERADLSDVTVDEALAHPTWSMGPKITIDSATLMNKGLEVIEAHHLFGFGYDEIEVVVHPQSVIHAAVRCADGTMVMQAAPPDMRLPIQTALTWPFSAAGHVATIDLAEVGRMTFEPVDRARFPSLDLAYEAGRKGATYPAALNAANEVAVGAFLEGTIGFMDIPAIVESVLGRHESGDAFVLDDVMAADSAAREVAGREIEARVKVAR
jgi:1-deoxy-D-xylulose-5-phosphate reductoisomerase